MEIELSTSAIDAIAYKVALIVEKRLREKEVFPDLVSTEEAARILGVTPRTMRMNKDKYKYTKTGDNMQGKLLFERKSLIK